MLIGQIDSHVRAVLHISIFIVQWIQAVVILFCQTINPWGTCATSKNAGARKSPPPSPAEKINTLMDRTLPNKCRKFGSKISRSYWNWRPTADWRCLANGRAATQACVASGSGPVTKAH